MMLDTRSPEWWQARSSRERALLALLAAISVTLVVWYGIASPLQRMAAQSEQHRTRASQLWIEVETARGALSKVTIPSDDELSDVLMLSAAEAGFVLDRHRLETAREIAIWGRATDPADLFTWISMLNRNHGLIVANVTAARDESGGLRVEALLVRGAP
jgi:type II secretory pathway component PulM